MSLLTEDETGIDFIKQISDGLMDIIETEYVNEADKVNNEEFGLTMNSEWGLNENDGNYSVLVAQKVFESVGESDSNSKKKKTILETPNCKRSPNQTQQRLENYFIESKRRTKNNNN